MHKYKKAIFIVMLALMYIVLGFYAVSVATTMMTEEYYALLGHKALDIAEITVANYYITDAEVEEMKAMTFREVLNHPANRRLAHLFESNKISQDLKYAYICMRLQDSEVKYGATEEVAGLLGVPVGTPLNLLWLADVVVGRESKEAVSKQPDYYDDITRYSVVQQDIYSAFDVRESLFLQTEGEYGSAFTGFVPLYTTEHNFVGLLGVDIYYESFTRRVSNVRSILTFMFLVPTLLLGVASAIIYVRQARRGDISASTDALTGLYNRRYLDKILPALVKEAHLKRTNLAVIMLDIDCFKNYNDNYGHKMGDNVIVRVTEAIASGVRQKGDVVCRYGGEEIIVLLPATDTLGALKVAAKIQDAVVSMAIPHQFGTASGIITVSQGVYSAVPEGVEKDVINRFIEYADIALYRAKHDGRGRYTDYRDGGESL